MLDLRSHSLSRLEHHIFQTSRTSYFSNIKRTQTCSSIVNRTRTPYYWLQTNELWTLFDSSLTIGHPLCIMKSILLNYLIWNIVKPIDGFVSKEMFLNAFFPVNLLFQSNWYLIPKQISASLSFAILTTDWQWQVDLASSHHKSVSGYGLGLHRGHPVCGDCEQSLCGSQSFYFLLIWDLNLRAQHSKSIWWYQELSLKMHCLTAASMDYK